MSEPTVALEISNASKRLTFFQIIWSQDCQGYVCFAFKQKGSRDFYERFYEYPTGMPDALEYVAQHDVGYDIYFCPQLFGERRRVKANVIQAPCLWADLDTCDPEKLVIPPTVSVLTSPGHWHAYWTMEDINVPVEDMEELARRIAYAHADDGADKTGWDLTQLLRVPYTTNYKYPDVPIVEIASVARTRYRPEDFDVYPKTQGHVSADIPMPDVASLPTAQILVEEGRLTNNPLIGVLFSEPPQPGKWSEDLWKLLTLLFEAGYSKEEVFAIAKESACNKYERDNRPDEHLWRDVVRAQKRVEITTAFMAPDEQKPLELLTDTERKLVQDAEPTFLERYIEWAASLGDAAPQYHQAGGLVCLSSVISGGVRLPTSYGAITPTLWFLILGSTTLTRKTTAMDIATDLIDEIDNDLIMATDGSLEGLFNGLATRPGLPSIFLRDEFSGLLDQMSRKDYLSGLPEMLTKLYDGKRQKRMLSKGAVEIRDPRLIIFAGGIKDRVTALLNQEMVSSGFVPRFVFILGEVDTKRIKPIGPPTYTNTSQRDAIIEELEAIKAHYNKVIKVPIDATMTNEAWGRYNELEAKILRDSMQAPDSVLQMPMGDRLAKSMWKTALLIAASRQKGEDVVVEELDLLRAISYGEKWLEWGRYIVANVAKGSDEQKLERILEGIIRSGEKGQTRADIMRYHRLMARDITNTLDTLEQRGLVVRQKHGRGEIFTATRLATVV